MVRAMDDDFQVTSEPYRLMPPRKRAGSDIGEALDAARVTGPELCQAARCRARDGSRAR